MAEAAAAAAEIVRAADTVASQRAVTRTLVLGYSQGGHIAWLLMGTGRFDIVIPVSGALVNTYQPPPSTGRTTIHALHGEDDRTVPPTASAAIFRAFTAAGYRGDYKRVHAGHSLTTIGDYIAPILSASIEPKPTRTPGLSIPQIRVASRTGRRAFLAASEAKHSDLNRGFFAFGGAPRRTPAALARDRSRRPRLDSLADRLISLHARTPGRRRG